MLRISSFVRIGLGCLVTAAAATLMAGPSGGDLSRQRPTYHIDYIPPAPVLTPQQELKTFKLPPGFHIELVAAEPMVEEPVALTFDPDGRIYVVEMRGYMPDAKGTDELAPIGRVVRLESSAGDGKYDKSTVFLDNLVVPRSVAVAGKGVLVGEPPNLWLCQDTKGDGRADQKTLLFSDYGVLKADAEYNPNGLMRSIDNWYYDADWGTRFNYLARKFHRESTISRGQYGIAQDDVGHLFYNNNSSLLRCDLVPAEDMAVNPFLDSPAGVNVQIALNKTYPSRVNPGVNRGYVDNGDLNHDGKLQRPTASCGPTIYRGAAFPAEYRGNAFICEPAGNLVSRQVLTQDGVAIKAEDARHDGIDFLTSTDERFRPVYVATAPDGSLYVVDLYHGILQHKTYLSAYLSDQIKKRDLENNEGHRGRIWRIVADSAEPSAMPHLSKASSEDLVKQLSNPNGWWRDTAQQLLVERHDMRISPLLERIVGSKSADTSAITKIHAIWTLQGIDSLEDDVAADATQDPDPRVRLAALRAGESMIRKRTGPGLLKALAGLANDPDPAVQLQVLALAAPDLPELRTAGSQILARHLSDPMFRAAAINGATGRELEMLQGLLTDNTFATETAGKNALFSELADCVIRGRSAQRTEQLISLIASQSAGNDAAKEALLAGIADAVAPNPKSKIVTRRIRMPHEPKGLADLIASSDKKIHDPAERVMAVMSWPGKPGDTTPPLTPLTAAQQKLYDQGHVIFGQICAACHQPSGLGMAGTAPPLVDSEWLLGPQDRVVRIVLNGLHGPIKVGKHAVDLEMPGLKVLTDEQIASALTYLRREWGHEGNPIEITSVERIRKEIADRGDSEWTAEELLAIR
jgi:mono/diheme cytochrome c family protein/glucose/arabinose dehydrogenase